MPTLILSLARRTGLAVVDSPGAQHRHRRRKIGLCRRGLHCSTTIDHRLGLARDTTVACCCAGCMASITATPATPPQRQRRHARQQVLIVNVGLRLVSSTRPCTEAAAPLNNKASRRLFASCECGSALAFASAIRPALKHSPRLKEPIRPSSSPPHTLFAPTRTIVGGRVELQLLTTPVQPQMHLLSLGVGDMRLADRTQVRHRAVGSLRRPAPAGQGNYVTFYGGEPTLKLLMRR